MIARVYTPINNVIVPSTENLLPPCRFRSNRLSRLTHVPQAADDDIEAKRRGREFLEFATVNGTSGGAKSGSEENHVIRDPRVRQRAESRATVI